MIRYTLFIILFLSLLSPLQAQQKREKLVNKILDAQERGDYPTAVKYLTELIQLEPENASAYALRADSYKNQKQYKLAILDLNTSISLNPTDYAYCMRGLCYVSLLNIDKAIDDYNKALELSEDSESINTIYINRGTAKLKKRDFMGAHDDYMYVYQTDTSDYSAVFGLSRAYMELREDSLSLVFLRKAEQLRPDDADVVNNFGFYYLEHEQYEQAMGYFKKSITMGNDGFAWNNLGFCKYKMGDYQGALKDINRSIELIPENSYAWKNRALVHLALNEKDSACVDLEKALELGYSVRYGYEVQELYNKNCK